MRPRPRHLHAWSAILVLVIHALPTLAVATPSTTFWAPSTPSVQPHGVLHVTYDTYFGRRAGYPVDAGLTIGVLPTRAFQAEVGFDLFYPTVGPAGPVDLPVVLNAKVGGPEDAWFEGQPAWSVGIFGVGFEPGLNDQHVLYAMVGRTLPAVGTVQVGGYHALRDDLFRNAEGGVERSGVLAGWVSPSFAAPRVDKVALAWDLQTGNNVLGATGGGVAVYFTPAIALLAGPVYFLEPALQPGGSRWMWSLQLDADLDLLGGTK